MGRVYNRTRSEEVAREMSGALDRAFSILRVEELVKELVKELEDVGLVGLPRDHYVRTWFHRFWTSKGYLAPDVVQPTCPNFLSAMGRRARKLGLSDTQKRAILS